VNQEVVYIWGDGTSIRDFLYIDDAVRAILLAIENYNNIEPLNIGTGIAKSIRDLVDIFLRVSLFKGKIIWERDKPNGIPFRVMNIDRQKQFLNCNAITRLNDGIIKIWNLNCLNNENFFKTTIT